MFYDLGILGEFLFLCGIVPVLGIGWSLFRFRTSAERDMLLLLWCSWLALVVNTFSHDPYLTVGNPGCWLFWLTACAIYKGSTIFIHNHQGPPRRLRVI